MCFIVSIMSLTVYLVNEMVRNNKSGILTNQTPPKNEFAVAFKTRSFFLDLEARLTLSLGYFGEKSIALSSFGIY